MDDLEELVAMLLPVGDRARAAVACSCAARLLPIYEAHGSGDVGVLKHALEGAWTWAEGGSVPSDLDASAETLEEYVEALYEEEDELLASVVNAARMALDVVRAAGDADTSALEAARALVLDADLSDMVDGVLADAGSSATADAEEEAWRGEIVELARRWRGPVDRTKFEGASAPPSWMPDFLAAFGG